MIRFLGKVNKPAFFGGFWVILTIFIFWGLNIIILDPDFGWHLRTGQLILSAGIPKTDPFSYTMPNFPYVDHAWGTDVIIYKGYLLFGQIGLALAFSLVGLLSLGLVLKATKKFYILTLILGVAVLANYSEIRPLVVTWVGLATLIFLFFRKKLFISPLIILVWANMHGGFLVGLVFLLFSSPVSFIISLPITFINPYGFGLWREVLSTVFDTSLKSSILEWTPAIFTFNPAAVFLAVIAVVFMWVFRKDFPKRYLLFMVFFVPYCFTATRNLPLLVLACIPIVNIGLEKLSNFPRSRLAIRAVTLISIAILIPSLFFSFRSANKLSEGNFYPIKATTFLKNRPPDSQVFSTFGWGGYLIWKLPEKKVFIDGRMPSWNINGYSAFKDYNLVLEGKSHLDKYNVEVILWDKTKPEFIKKLNWPKIYEDNIAVIYENK